MVHGLKRAWASQVGLDRARDHVESIVLWGETLYAQSTRGTIHALDAETGRTRWVVPVGNREHPTLAPGANSEFVAVLNGTNFYLLRADSGRTVWERPLDFVPSAPPVLNETHCFLVMMNGMLAAYALPTAKILEQLAVQEAAGAEPDPVEQREPWSARSSGTPLSRPTVTAHSVAWTTEAGLAYVVDLDKQELQFEFRARDEIASSPAFQWPYFFVTSRDHNVYAFHERTGREAWRFAADSPVLEPPVVLGETLCIVPQDGGMHCLALDDGRHLWWSPQATQFVAASPTRIYVADAYSRILILDRRSGVRVDVMATERLPFHVFNDQNDRLYLGTASGLVQCLREVGLEQPAVHPRQLAEPVAAEKPVEEGASDADAAPAEGADEAAPADDAVEPESDEP